MVKERRFNSSYCTKISFHMFSTKPFICFLKTFLMILLIIFRIENAIPTTFAHYLTRAIEIIRKWEIIVKNILRWNISIIKRIAVQLKNRRLIIEPIPNNYYCFHTILRHSVHYYSDRCHRLKHELLKFSYCVFHFNELDTNSHYWNLRSFEFYDFWSKIVFEKRPEINAHW